MEQRKVRRFYLLYQRNIMQEIVISNDQFSGEYNLILKYIFMCQDQRDLISYEFI